MKHTWLIGAAVLQSACSLLIRVDDGIDEDVDAGLAQGGSTSEIDPPDGGPPAAEAGSSGSGGAGGIAAFGGGAGDGGLVAGGADSIGGSAGFAGGESDAGGDGGVVDVTEPPRPVFDLAFVEDPAESAATLRLVNTELALSSPNEQDPEWRISLRPAEQFGDVLDFAWSPNGERIAVRFEGPRGPQLAFFEAPDWLEVERTEAGSPAALPDLVGTANYRWSPSSNALALEMIAGEQPFVGGYVLAEGEAFGLEPVPFTGPIETLDWLSATSLYVVQPDEEDPEFIELRLSQRAFEAPVSLLTIGVFLPIDLRHVPGGVIGATDLPTTPLYFWSEQGTRAAFLPSSYLSSGQSFAAEVNPNGADIYPIGDSASLVDTVPDCSTILAWMEGPDPRSIAGAKLACLDVQDDAATISIRSYASNADPTTIVLDDETLRTDFASTEDWEAHARGFSPDGGFIALASAPHDALIDLRASSATYSISAAASEGGTARGFSPSGRYLLQQRGRSAQFVVLSPAADLPPTAFELPEAATEVSPCATGHHALSWCGAPSAARLASGRWSFGSDRAVYLASSEGLTIVAPSAERLGGSRTPVSTCGASCVGQYAFGR